MLSVPRAVHDLPAPARSSVRPSVCLSRKLGLEISFRLRCTSYLLHAETPPSLLRHTGTKTDTRFFLFLPSNRLTPPSVVSPASLSPLHVIVSRKDRSVTDRATGNKTAPSTILSEELYMHRSHGPLQCPSPFHEGCSTRR